MEKILNEPTESPQKKKSLSTILTVILIVLAVGLIGTATYQHFNPTQVDIPKLEEAYAVPTDDPAVTQEESIPGANTGRENHLEDTKNPNAENSNSEPGGEQEPTGGEAPSAGATEVPQDLGFELAEGYEVYGIDPQTGVAQVSGPDVAVPGVGDLEAGEEGALTEDTPTERRSSNGDPISRELAAECPNMTSGSMCIPKVDEVIYWHSVGTRNSTTNGSLVMAVPSTRTAGWLKDSAPLGANEGTSIFAAHVVFSGGVPGPFYEVNKLRAGDEIIMRDMNGKNYTYRVYASEVTEGTSLPDEVYRYKDVPHRIALVTCTGTYLEGTYEQRLIVWAAPVR